MATINLSLSTKVDATGRSEILIRFTHGGGTINQRGKSNIFIPAEQWDKDSQKIIIPNPRVLTPEKRELKQYITEQSEKLNLLTSLIHSLFNEIKDKKSTTPDWLVDTIDRFYQRGKYAPKEEIEEKQTLFSLCNEFLEKYEQSAVRAKNFRVIVRTLRRFETYIKKTENKNFALLVETTTPDTLQKLSKFLSKEDKISIEFPEIYEQPAKPDNSKERPHKPQPRGQNTINDIMKRLRTLFIWAVKLEKTTNNPFKNFEIKESVYGTPYYITIEERNHLYNTDLSHRPALEVQRDIFIFQCLIGCRVADLYRLTKQNVINGEIHYIARKTKDGRPETVEVPLNTIAKEILKKYVDFSGNTLFPYISEQKYNEAIKEVFTVAKITRPVVVLDAITREGVVRPINEVASSHLARRCFVGNLYKQVKDPNLIGKLSGHAEGSRAFTRYRDIDRDMKNELVKMLE
jgi:integrase